VPINLTLTPTRRGSLYYLAYWAGVGTFLPFTNVYFVSLGLSGRELGLLAALLPLTSLMVAPALASLADRRGWRVRILALALAGLALGLILLALPRSFAALLPLMALLALTRSPIGPIADSLVARMAARHRLNFGSMRLWGSLGFALVAIASGALWQRIGYEWMFLLAGLAFLPVALCARLLEEGPVVERAARRPLREVGRDRGLLVLLAAACLVGAALGMDGAFQGVYVGHLGGGGLIVGLLFGVSAFSEFPSMRYAGAIGRRLGGPGALLLSYVLLGAAYAGFALARDPLVLVPLAVVKGFGFGLYFVSTVRLVDERTPPEWASTIQAALNAGAGGLAPLVASLLGGAIYDALGPAAVFVACACALVLAMLVLLAAVARGVFKASPKTRA
jgi:MFS transporter, PPP family, 3-phenylpropionic acid transporter